MRGAAHELLWGSARKQRVALSWVVAPDPPSDSRVGWVAHVRDVDIKEKIMGDFENKKDEFVGKAKEAAGNVSDNEKLENEGKADQVSSEAKQKASDAVEGVKDKANEVIGNLKD